MSSFRPISFDHLVGQISHLAYVRPTLILRLSIYNMSYLQLQFVSKFVTKKVTSKTKKSAPRKNAILLLIPTRNLGQSIGRMSIGRISIGRMSIGRMSIGRMSVSHKSGCIVCRGLIRTRILSDACYLP